MRISGWMPWRRAGAKGVEGKGAGPAERKAAAGFVTLQLEAEARWSARSYAALSREGYMRNPVAHRAVRMIAEAAASVPWLAYRGEREVPDEPVLAVLARPNGGQPGTEFLEALYGHLMLSGNAYVDVARLADAPRALHLLRPDRIRVVEGRDGWPEAYEYRVGNAARRYGAGDGGLLHLRLFHPLDDHMGFAPLEAASMALDLSNAAAGWNKALIDNSARPSGALVYQPKDGGNLSPQQFERLKAELEDGYSGPARAGRPMLLEGGLDWKAMGLSPREMDFVEARNGAARDIALAFGVPPMLIGIPGDATYANYQEANRAFWRLTVVPLVTRTASAFAAFFSAGTGEGRLRLVPDLDQVTGLSAERGELWSRVEAASFLTEAEKRAAVGYAVAESE
ncbi:phage portal protein, HK97 family [Rhizobium sp. RU20A]|uniref:phage portal protein n=1 Tax=Rhizobium sp. RU20A TaxID=1907412 RepID=UPI00095752D9|nr:phage portal protein [Rhizobium sp. RU20A]SIR16042.1 phage portal protein, HK97 family [Rhizobium sp. RU20A]